MEHAMKLTYRQRTGQERRRFAHKNSNPDATNRRLGVIMRLEEQLTSKTKSVWSEQTNPMTGEPEMALTSEPLTEKDVTRIKKEIAILKSRI